MNKKDILITKYTKSRSLLSDSDPFTVLFHDRPKLHGAPGKRVSWSISEKVAEYIYKSVGPESCTLETGSGVSTIVFAIKRTKHVTVSPSLDEKEAIRDYASLHSIKLDTVRFVNETSESYLPNAVNEGELDFVLIDGRHAFPWPVIDYFYTSTRLRKGGILVVDDITIPSVVPLVRFLLEDDNWQLSETFPKRTLAFVKIGTRLNVEWTEQRYNQKYYRSMMRNPNLFRRGVRKVRRTARTIGRKITSRE